MRWSAGEVEHQPGGGCPAPHSNFILQGIVAAPYTLNRSAESPESTPLSGRWLILAWCWFVGFTALFFSTRLPNNSSVTRHELLFATPQLLLDILSPLEPQTPEERQAADERGWRFLPQRFPLWIVALGVATGAQALGRLLLRVTPFQASPSGLERFVIAQGAGLSVWSLLVLAAGLAGLLVRELFVGVLVGAVIVEVVAMAIGSRWRKSAIDASPTGTAAQPSQDPSDLWKRRFSVGQWKHWLAAACVPFLVLIALGAALPSTDFDVNEYHFGGPKEYFQNGKIGFLPHNVYTSFPFLTEMLTLSCMVILDDWFWGALAGKCLLALFAPLTALALYALGRRFNSSTVGPAAAFVYLSTPWVFRYSTIAYVEGALACYGLLALLAATHLRPVEPTAAVSNKNAFSRGWLFWIGFLAGSGMACKYPGLVSVVIPMMTILLFAVLEHVPNAGETGEATSKLRVISLFVPCFGIAIAIGPWLIKNLLETGNPVYPLGWTLFGGVDWDAELNVKWRQAHSPNGYSLFSLFDQMFDVTIRNDWLSPLLYGFALIALLPDPRRSSKASNRRWCWLVAGVATWQFLSYWLLTHRLDRFWTPMLPFVALLAGVGLARLLDTISGCKSLWQRRGAGLAVGVVVVGAGCFNFVFESTGLAGYNDFLRDLPAARQFAARITMPEIVWLNDHLPPNARVLAVGDAELFEARFPVIYNTVFDKSLFEEYCGDMRFTGPSADRPLRSAEQISAAFHSAGITHVYVNWNEILRYRTTYGYTDFVSPERMSQLMNAGILITPVTPSEAIRPVSGLAPSWQAQVETWGKTLVTKPHDAALIPMWQVFEVR